MTAATHPNVELVLRMYEAFAATDYDTILTLVDPEIHVSQTDELPWGGEYDGYEGLAAFFGRLREVIASEVTHNAVYAAGERVVQTGRTAGTVNATGVAFDVAETHILTIRDGKVVRFEAFIDTPAMLSALRKG
jgi:uncharacterized protein